MILDRVTITGVDDSVAMAHPYQLSIQYPFVEWGILFSADRQGSSRYPSFEWLRLFHRFEETIPVNWSAHLCGRWARDAMVGRASWWEAYGHIAPRFGRVQLNLADVTYPSSELNDGMLRSYHATSTLLRRPHRFIIQSGASPEPSELAQDLVSVGSPHARVLFDGSGGRGMLSKSWQHAWWPSCGYAGGLNPDNVVEQLKLMATCTSANQRIWIDMESGVRTDDRFDLGKVRRVLELCAPFVGKEMGA